jgi:CubicO group peptidase (beta-lactamase class C family)
MLQVHSRLPSYLAIGTGVVATLCSVIAAGQEVSQQSLDQAKQEMHAAIESGQVAGAAHLVCRDGMVVHLEVAGVSDIETGAPLTTDTIMRIYSMSKPITSVAAMTLYEQGKFRLDDPVAKYIPAFESTTVFVKQGGEHELVPAERPITVRDLFRHTAGYGYGGGSNKELHAYYEREQLIYRPPNAMMPPEMTIAQAADALARIPAFHHPGQRFTYGLNTDVLGRLIEIWSDQSLDAYMREVVFDPLKMVDTGFLVPADQRDRFASCHTLEQGKLAVADKGEASPYNEGFDFLSGGGGLVSTIGDYANFCQMMVDGGRFDGKQILKESTVELMFTNQLEDVKGDFRFGLGFAIDEVELGSGDTRRTATQYWWAGYASTDFRLVPEERLFQIVLRQRVPSSHGLARRLFPIVYQGVE